MGTILVKRIYTGLESSGKGYMLSIVLTNLVNRNAKLAKKTKYPRNIYCNYHLKEKFINYAKNKGINIYYYKNLIDIIDKEHCDIIIDEIGKYFDAQDWKDLPQAIKYWLPECHKRGISIYATAQDYMQVAINFRRLTNELYYVKKILGTERPDITIPKPLFHYAIFLKYNSNPRDYDTNKPDIDLEYSWLPSIHFLQKKYYEIFDTLEKIGKPEKLPLKHEERKCLECGFTKISHT